MARPKKEHAPVRGHKYTIRLSSEEDELLDTLARKAEMTKSDYMRSLISGRTPTIKYELVYNSREILKIFRNLGNISGNLNQIAHHLNAGGGWNDEMKKEVSGCIAQILHIRDEVKEMVGEYRGDSETHSDS